MSKDYRKYQDELRKMRSKLAELERVAATRDARDRYRSRISSSERSRSRSRSRSLSEHDRDYVQPYPHDRSRNRRRRRRPATKYLVRSRSPSGSSNRSGPEVKRRRIRRISSSSDDNFSDTESVPAETSGTNDCK